MTMTTDSHCQLLLHEAWLLSMTEKPCFTDESLAELAGLRKQGICWWHRCADLREQGLISRVYNRQRKPLKVIGSNGRQVGVCRITAAGIELAKTQCQEDDYGVII